MVKPTSSAKLLITFENLTEALKLEKLCRARQLAGKLIPTPRRFSASCSLSWQCPPNLEAELQDLLAGSNVRAYQFHHL